MMSQHHVSGFIYRIIAKVLLTVGKVIDSHRMIRAGRRYRHIGDAQSTMADARAIIQRCMKRAALHAGSRSASLPAHTSHVNERNRFGNGSVVSIK